MRHDHRQYPGHLLCSHVGLQVVLHSPDVFAPVGVLHPTQFHTEPKQPDESVAPARIIDMPVEWRPSAVEDTPAQSTASTAAGFTAEISAWESSQYILLQCCPSATSPDALPASPEDMTAAAVHAALIGVEQAAQERVLSLEDALFVHLHLLDMRHFAAANAAYCQHLPKSQPASRACVQVPLPEGRPLMVDVLLRKRHPKLSKSVLHVQSISCWAPSCIGPYSQVRRCWGQGAVVIGCRGQGAVVIALQLQPQPFTSWNVLS